MFVYELLASWRRVRKWRVTFVPQATFGPPSRYFYTDQALDSRADAIAAEASGEAAYIYIGHRRTDNYAVALYYVSL